MQLRKNAKLIIVLLHVLSSEYDFLLIAEKGNQASPVYQKIFGKKLAFCTLIIRFQYFSFLIDSRYL